MGDRRCVCGHLESEHLGGEVTLCAVRENGGSDGLYADFCLKFTETEAEAAPVEVKALADYPPPNKRPCPQCAGTMNLFNENSETDLWWCLDCTDYVELPTLRSKS